MNYHSESAFQPINKKRYFSNACRISGYFDTKCTTIVQIEPILQKSEDLKIDNILNLEQVYFLMTRIIWWSRLATFASVNVNGIFQYMNFVLIDILVGI